MTNLTIAAIVYPEGDGVAVDATLAAVALSLRRRGLRIAGAVQHNTEESDRCRCDMLLEDLASGRIIDISEKRGPQSSGCRLDSFALEEVVGLVGTSLTSSPDVVIINRFGKREADGRGFRPVIEDALGREIPVLVAVGEGQLSAWQAFAAGLDQRLDLDTEAITVWCERASSASVGRDVDQRDRAGLEAHEGGSAAK